MDYITNINSILDKSLMELVEDYYYSYEINIPPIKLNPLFNIPLLSYIHKYISRSYINFNNSWQYMVYIHK